MLHSFPFYSVEISTPEDDVVRVAFPDEAHAVNLFDSIVLSDERVPRVSVFRNDPGVVHEIRRKETYAWRAAVERAHAEEMEA